MDEDSGNSSQGAIDSTGTTRRRNIATYLSCIHIDVDFVTQYQPLLVLASYVSATALFVGAMVLLFDQFEVRLAVVLVMAASVVSFVLYKTKDFYSPIGKTGLFFFFVNALAPDTDTAFFFWYTSYENGPKFPPRFVGYIFAVSYGAMFIGILFYNRYIYFHLVVSVIFFCDIFICGALTFFILKISGHCAISENVLYFHFDGSLSRNS